MKQLLLALTAVLVAACMGSTPSASPTPSLPVDQPAVPNTGSLVTDFADWNTAHKIVGFGTTYDAYNHAKSWYDNPRTWVSVDPENRYLSKSKCKNHPEWKCYYRSMGSWSKLVRPWNGVKHVDNLYAAIGPYLRQRIADQMPRWHQIPTYKLLITSLVTHKSVEVWIVDYCDCRQRHPDGPASAWSLVDLSPQAWEALGAYKHGHSGPNINGWSNKIEVRFLP
jgi:hypothetical protein